MKIYKYIPIISLITIVIFVNFNDKDNYVWWLVHYAQFYLLVFGFIYIGFKLTKSVFTRSVLYALGFYYIFEFAMDILRIYNDVLWDKLYESRNINYILSIGLAFGLIVLPLCNRLLKLIKKLFKK